MASDPVHGYIVILRQQGNVGSRFPVCTELCTIGRGIKCSVRIHLASVADKHCIITSQKKQGLSTIKNLSTSSSTFLNGVNLDDGTAMLHHGDVITLGGRSFRWEYPQSSQFWRKSLSEKNVMVKLPAQFGKNHLKVTATSLSVERSNPQNNQRKSMTNLARDSPGNHKTMRRKTIGGNLSSSPLSGQRNTPATSKLYNVGSTNSVGAKKRVSVNIKATPFKSSSTPKGGAVSRRSTAASIADINGLVKSPELKSILKNTLRKSIAESANASKSILKSTPKQRRESLIKDIQRRKSVGRPSMGRSSIVATATPVGGKRKSLGQTIATPVQNLIRKSIGAIVTPVQNMKRKSKGRTPAAATPSVTKTRKSYSKASDARPVDVKSPRGGTRNSAGAASLVTSRGQKRPRDSKSASPERAAKVLKLQAPKSLDKKKMAALMVCHGKGLEVKQTAGFVGNKTPSPSSARKGVASASKATSRKSTKSATPSTAGKKSSRGSFAKTPGSPGKAHLQENLSPPINQNAPSPVKGVQRMSGRGSSAKLTPIPSLKSKSPLRKSLSADLNSSTSPTKPAGRKSGRGKSLNLGVSSPKKSMSPVNSEPTLQVVTVTPGSVKRVASSPLKALRGSIKVTPASLKKSASLPKSVGRKTPGVQTARPSAVESSFKGTPVSEKKTSSPKSLKIRSRASNIVFSPAPKAGKKSLGQTPIKSSPSSAKKSTSQATSTHSLSTSPKTSASSAVTPSPRKSLKKSGKRSNSGSARKPISSTRMSQSNLKTPDADVVLSSPLKRSGKKSLQRASIKLTPASLKKSLSPAKSTPTRSPRTPTVVTEVPSTSKQFSKKSLPLTPAKSSTIAKPSSDTGSPRSPKAGRISASPLKPIVKKSLSRISGFSKISDSPIIPSPQKSLSPKALSSPVKSHGKKSLRGSSTKVTPSTAKKAVSAVTSPKTGTPKTPKLNSSVESRRGRRSGESSTSATPASPRKSLSSGLSPFEGIGFITPASEVVSPMKPASRKRGRGSSVKFTPGSSKKSVSLFKAMSAKKISPITPVASSVVSSPKTVSAKKQSVSPKSHGKSKLSTSMLASVISPSPTNDAGRKSLRGSASGITPLSQKKSVASKRSSLGTPKTPPSLVDSGKKSARGSLALKTPPSRDVTVDQSKSSSKKSTATTRTLTKPVGTPSPSKQTPNPSRKSVSPVKAKTPKMTVGRKTPTSSVKSGKKSLRGSSKLTQPLKKSISPAKLTSPRTPSPKTPALSTTSKKSISSIKSSARRSMAGRKSSTTASPSILELSHKQTVPSSPVKLPRSSLKKSPLTKTLTPKTPRSSTAKTPPRMSKKSSVSPLKKSSKKSVASPVKQLKTSPAAVKKVTSPANLSQSDLSSSPDLFYVSPALVSGRKGGRFSTIKLTPQSVKKGTPLTRSPQKKRTESLGSLESTDTSSPKTPLKTRASVSSVKSNKASKTKSASKKSKSPASNKSLSLKRFSPASPKPSRGSAKRKSSVKSSPTFKTRKTETPYVPKSQKRALSFYSPTVWSPQDISDFTLSSDQSPSPSLDASGKKASARNKQATPRSTKKFSTPKQSPLKKAKLTTPTPLKIAAFLNVLEKRTARSFVQSTPISIKKASPKQKAGKSPTSSARSTPKQKSVSAASPPKSSKRNRSPTKSPSPHLSTSAAKTSRKSTPIKQILSASKSVAVLESKSSPKSVSRKRVLSISSTEVTPMKKSKFTVEQLGLLEGLRLAPVNADDNFMASFARKSQSSATKSNLSMNSSPSILSSSRRSDSKRQSASVTQTLSPRFSSNKRTSAVKVMSSSKRGSSPKSRTYSAHQSAIKSFEMYDPADITNFDFDAVKTPNVPKEYLVSPSNSSLSTSGRKTSGNAKNLFSSRKGQKSPRNSLSNLSGVKTIFKSPRDQKSPKNDLSDVKGVKAMFKTPTGKRSPKNDLTDVKGVNTLFKTPRGKKSPKNDLTNVKGVKAMFKSPRGRKFPENDRTDIKNVEGIEVLFKSPRGQKSPRNDLTDVQGVRKLMKGFKSPNYADLSSLGHLFLEDVSPKSGVQKSVQSKSPNKVSPKASSPKAKAGKGQKKVITRESILIVKYERLGSKGSLKKKQGVHFDLPDSPASSVVQVNVTSSVESSPPKKTTKPGKRVTRGKVDTSPIQKTSPKLSSEKQSPAKMGSPNLPAKRGRPKRVQANISPAPKAETPVKRNARGKTAKIEKETSPVKGKVTSKRGAMGVSEVNEDIVDELKSSPAKMNRRGTRKAAQSLETVKSPPPTGRVSKKALKASVSPKAKVSPIKRRNQGKGTPTVVSRKQETKVSPAISHKGISAINTQVTSPQAKKPSPKSVGRGKGRTKSSSKETGKGKVTPDRTSPVKTRRGVSKTALTKVAEKEVLSPARKGGSKRKANTSPQPEKSSPKKLRRGKVADVIEVPKPKKTAAKKVTKAKGKAAQGKKSPKASPSIPTQSPVSPKVTKKPLKVVVTSPATSKEPKKARAVKTATPPKEKGARNLSFSPVKTRRGRAATVAAVKKSPPKTPVKKGKMGTKTAKTSPKVQQEKKTRRAKK